MEEEHVGDGISFEELFPGTDPELIKLIRGMLEFNPYYRMTVE